MALKITVVSDPELAAAISLLRGQWQAETGGALTVDEISAEQLLGDDFRSTADVIIYPTRLLGTLAEREMIRPLEQTWLADEHLDWADIFALLKAREVTWGSQTYALPLGSPVLACTVREDLLKELGRNPPRTWEEYQRLASELALRDSAKAVNPAEKPPVAAAGAEASAIANWAGAIEPLAPGWAGLTLLARAAPYARHANHYSTLFNMQSMEPLVATPPFVRALTELVAATKPAREVSLRATPAEAWEAVASGRAGMALAWPAKQAAHDQAQASAEPAVEVTCVELPGSVDVFNATTAKWERRAGGPESVPLVSPAGLVASITAKSANPQAGLRLLIWLASRKWSAHASARSDATTLFRSSQLSDQQTWTGSVTGSSSGYATTVAASLGAADCFVAPRLPGAERYLAVLDEAVRSAVQDGVDPRTALSAAADKFRAITTELGLDQQRKAYRRSLGLE